MDRLLLILLLVPLAGAAVCAFLPEGPFVKFWALGTCLTTLAVVLILTPSFTFHQSPDVQPTVIQSQAGGLTAADRVERTVQLRYEPQSFAVTQLGFGFRLGMDTISYWLVLLTAFLTPLAVAGSFKSIVERQREFYGWILALLAFVIGVFLARDVLLFYVFFELTLIPMFFIIGVFGGPERRRASTKYFLYTFAGSVFLLAGLVYLGLGTNRVDGFSFAAVTAHAQSLPASTRFWIFLALMAGFAVKVPLVPLHTWQPLAYTEAPTGATVLLAGVLLKMGTYGILRLALPAGLVGAGAAANGAIRFFAVLCLIGILYCGLIAWVQRDMKRLVAYSSISHLGFCVLGLLALNTIGLQGSVLYMVNHGISTAALFLLIGMIAERYRTRDLDHLSGLAKSMPVMAFFFVLFVMSSIGLPGTNGFVSEFLTILGAFTSGHLGFWYGTVAATGVVLGAIYMLHMTARVIFGPLVTPDLSTAGAAELPAGTHNTVTRNTHDPETLTAGANADIAADAPDKPYQPEDTARRGPAVYRDGSKNMAKEAPGDLTWREIVILLPLAAAVIVLGVMPTPFLNSIELPVALVQTPANPVLPIAKVPDIQPVAVAALENHRTARGD